MARSADTGRRAAAARRLAAAAALAAAVLWAQGPSFAAAKPPAAIVAKTRAKISFTVAGAGQPPGGHTYAISRITIDGRVVRAAPGMTLDAKTGAFSWTPTESQAGACEIVFLATDAAGKDTRLTRRITVQPGAIASGNSKLAQRLRIWHAAGTAAGNTGDLYDNRDGGHSRLNVNLFPQLDRVEYTEQQKKIRLHWGPQLRMLFKHVTIGNSSTSATPAAGGCNPRQCLMSPRAMDIHYTQYRRNHLYVYPEHRDYDPGHNGRGGYGDLFPANTPYVITSQGSSGTDQAFLRALAYTLAAFRPEVKEALTKAGLLMPTVQMIFRISNTNVRGRKAYLTGEAHPPVFNGDRIDVKAMVEAAHDMTADAVPPMIQLSVVEEDPAVCGRDYFDAFTSEKLFDTPAAIARVARSTGHVRRMVISARSSFDMNRRKLTYHWVVLQGDAARIGVKPLNSEKSIVELRVPHHARRPIREGSRMESNRVDIGAFVFNGRYYSAPGFVSIFFLDNEARAYDSRGRIVEVNYGHGDTRIGWHARAARGAEFTDYGAFVDLIAGGGSGLGADLLRRQFKGGPMMALRQAAGDLRAARARISKAEADPAARKELAAARAALAEALTKRRPALNASLIVCVEDAVNAVKNDLNFYFTHARALTSLCGACEDKARKAACEKAAAELRELAARLAGNAKRPAERPFDDGLGPYHRNRIEQLNIAILQNVVYPDLLTWRWRPNFVPPRIATPKTWRDVYRYAPDGRLIGWTRHRGDKQEHFTADGAVITKRDPLGRALVARTVRYVAERSRSPWSLKQQAGSTVLHYTYDSESDRVGHVARTEQD